MKSTFIYKGGIANLNRYDKEKFLLFFVIEGVEIPIYQMIRDGLVFQGEKSTEFFTMHRIAKIFVSQQGFGIQKKYHSFYIELMPDEQVTPKITVTSFSKEANMTLIGKFHFLKKQRVLKILGKESLSYRFIKQQQPLPIKKLNEMISIDRSDMRKNVRCVRIRSK